MIAHLMTTKGGDYLLVLSIGGTLFIFLPFMGDAICQALTTLISQIIGGGNFQLLDRCIWSGNILALSIIAIFSMPLILFPIETFHYLFPTIELGSDVIRKIF